MKTNRENVLTGSHNKRLNNTDTMHNEGTAAWADTHQVMARTAVSIPSVDNTINAKDWVDDGSKL